MKEVITDRDSLQKQKEAAEGRAAALSTDLATAELSVRHLQQQFDQTDKALESAHDRSDRLQDKNRLLGRETSVLEGRLKQLQQSL